MTDIFDFTDNLSNFSNEDLRTLLDKIEKEIQCRKNNQRKKLIENFKSAFLALQSAGIDVHCADRTDEVDFRIYSWDDFYFD